MQGSAKAVAGPTMGRGTVAMTADSRGVTRNKIGKVLGGGAELMVVTVVVLMRVVVMVVSMAMCTEKTGWPS